MVAGFNSKNLTTVGVAGIGAVAAAIVQSSVTGFSIGDNTRDLILLAGAVVLTAMDGHLVKAFGIGAGAAVIGGLIRRNVLVG